MPFSAKYEVIGLRTDLSFVRVGDDLQPGKMPAGVPGPRLAK